MSFVRWILVAGLCATLGFLSPWAYAQTTDGKEITVYIPQRAEPWEGKGLLIEGSTVVPVRAVGEALDMAVHWDAQTRTVRVEDNDDPEWGLLRVGEDIAAFYTGDGPAPDKCVDLEMPVFIRNDRAMVPLRTFFELFRVYIFGSRDSATILTHETVEEGYWDRAIERERSCTVDDLAALGISQDEQ